MSKRLAGWPTMNRWLVGLLLATAAPWVLAACDTSATASSLGEQTSLELADFPVSSTVAGGLRCSAVGGSGSYLRMTLMSASDGMALRGPDGLLLPYSLKAEPTGTNLSTGTVWERQAIPAAALFSGPSGSIPLHLSSIPTAALKAGVYTGTVQVLWQYSVSSVDGNGSETLHQSPGFVRPGANVNLDWGVGVATTLILTLRVTNDCVINARDLDFGASPLINYFPQVSGNVSVKCSAGAQYSLGLSDGLHASGGVRRMHSNGHYLNYEIYKQDQARWGSTGGERWSSDAASLRPGAYDGSTTQGYSYTAKILTGQSVPPDGVYTDRLVIDVQF